MIIHIFQSGETLSGVASRYGVSVADVVAANDIASPDEIAVGQSLLIPQASEIYTLQTASGVRELSEALGVSLKDLLQNNPGLTPDDLLQAGESVVLSYGPKEREIEIVGYAYPFIPDERLNAALPYLSDLTVFTYGFEPSGALIAPQVDDARLADRANAYGSRAVLLLSTLGPDGTFDNRLSSALLTNEEAQERLISELISVMEEKGYEGLDIDFEYIEPAQKDAYAAFVRRTTNALNERGFSVLVALAPKTSAEQPGLLYEAHDYRALSEAANGVLLMTYEWGYTYGPPQAVAPLDKVRAVVDYALTEIPAEKILLGVPNYGYDWTLPYVPGSAARSLSTKEAQELAARTRAEILYDEVSASPYFYYTDEQGARHVVWFEDVRSFSRKLDLLVEKRLDGYALWTVMRPSGALFLLSASRFEIEA